MAHLYDCIVVGGGPCGATAATQLAEAGYDVALMDKAGRIKPCGGAIPPVAIRNFDIPDDQIVARIRSARMVAPSGKQVPMPIEGGYVGMVDREHFDEFLRARASKMGATRVTGSFVKLTQQEDGTVAITYRPKGVSKDNVREADAMNAEIANADPDGDEKGPLETLRARVVIGADGARSAVAKQSVKGAERVPCVFAYHEIVESPEPSEDFDPVRCDVWYQGRISPDFYGWVFPHGSCTSIGVGSANKGFSLRGATKALREAVQMEGRRTIRREGAPIPLKPMKKWDNGKNVVLAGDAAGVVAPSSGEGIFYAMDTGRMAADAVDQFLITGDAKALAGARKAFGKAHGKVFWVLGLMQYFWYQNDKRRERFVKMCEDPDVQHLTWQAYMNKELVRAKPAAHMKIFFKDLGHLFGLGSPS
jgi:geranylgeranyl reductase